MDTRFPQSLDSLRQRMGQAQAALATAVAAGAAIRDGADPSGCITVMLDDAGNADDIQVAPGWRRRLASDGTSAAIAAAVAAAVVAADHEAAQRRAYATASALGRSPSTAAGSHNSTADSVADSTVESSLRWPAGIEPVPPAPGPRRTLSELTAAVWSAFDELDQVTAPPGPVQGVAADGAVRLTLANGRITAIRIDPAWLGRQDEATLAHALRQALANATRLARQAQEPLRSYAGRLDDLLAEVMAHLRPNERGGDDDTAHGR